MNNAQIKQKDLDMVQSIIDHIYGQEAARWYQNMPREAKKEFKKELKRSKREKNL